MYAAAPRADVGGGALAGALMAIFTFLLAPSIDNFDFNVLFGAVGVILPFVAGYMPRKWKSIYMSLVGILALVVVGLVEFALTGTISDATKSMAPPLLTALLVSYLADPKHPEERSTRVLVEAAPAEDVPAPRTRKRSSRTSHSD